MSSRIWKIGVPVVLLIACLALLGGPSIWLGRAASAVNGARFAPEEERVYREVDGEDLQIAMYGHATRTETPRPAILWIHGGGWTTGDRAMLFPQAAAFAERGWVTFSTAYRTYGSHGTDAHTALEDVRAAFRYVREHSDEFGIDVDRIVLGGGSAGGHLSAAAAMIAPEAPVAALVLLNPAIDTALDPLPPGWAAIAPRFAGRGRDISPTHHVAPGQPPAIVLHGDEDGMVPIEHARRFCRDMRSAGNVCELEEYTGAGHGFFNHGFGHFDDVIAQIEQFLERQGLKGS